MRKMIAWPVVWAMYATGHLISRAFLQFDCLAFMYRAYNILMCRSADLQDWAALESGPWYPRQQ